MSDRFGLRVFGGGLIAGLAIAAFAMLLALAPKASALTIDTDGPLDGIEVNEQLSCQILRGDGEFFLREFDFNDFDQCGTFVGFEGEGATVYGDTNVAANENYVHDEPNQTLTGDGSPGNPYRLTTVVYVPLELVDEIESAGEGDVSPAVEGPTILRLTQTDSYVNGDEHYRTDIVVDNTLGDDVSATLYHAGDCALRDSSVGYAVEDDGGFAFCTPTQPTETATAAFEPHGPDPAILGFVPIEPDHNWREALASDLFDEVNGLDFGDLCDNCGLDPFEDEPVDNGVGLSWPIELDPEESMHVCFVTVDSWAGSVPSLPSGCTPASNPPETLAAQQPSSCKLRISRARVFLFRNHPRLRLVARYRSTDPGNVEISYTAVQNGIKDRLGEVVRHFSKRGIFRLRKELTEEKADELWTTDRFIVRFKIPGEPGFCARRYRKELTVPRIVEGQRVIFQADSDFPQPGSGHPE
jgi:hypothetical protein